MYQACMKLYNDWLHQYQGCYISACPTIFDVKQTHQIPEGSTLADEYETIRDSWYQAHPGELEKEIASKKAWEAERDRHFRVVYGIVRRHGCYLEWHGKENPCCGDSWTIYKNGKKIARLSVL